MDKMKKLFKDYQSITRYNEPMARHTSWRIGGPVEVFITPQNNDQLLEIYQICLKEGLPVFVLGGGTNLLVKDEGIKGVVIRIGSKQIQVKNDIITVETGYSLAHLVAKSIERGLTGLEAMAGVPGSVGGAIAMNAGGKYGNIGDVISRVRGIKRKADRGTKKNIEIITLSKSQLRFGYRFSNIKDKFIVLEARLELTSSTPRQVKALFQEVLIEKQNIQPLAAKSAGCVFKNPSGRLTAGQLIEKVGLKATRIGDASIATKHANFFINRGKAKARDVLKLIDIVQHRVYQERGVKLELEIEIW